jgi:hypothetical protein
MTVMAPAQSVVPSLPVTLEHLPPFAFTIEKAIAAGSILRVRASGVVMLRQLKIEKITVPGKDCAFACCHEFSPDHMDKNWDFYISTMSLAEYDVGADIARGAIIEIHAHRVDYHILENRPKVWSSRYSGFEWTMRLGIIPECNSREGFEMCAEPVSILLTAGKPDHIEAYLKPDGRIQVQHFDAFGNPATEAKPGGAIEGGGINTAFSDSDSAAAARVALDSAAPLPGRITAVDKDNRRAMSNALPRTPDNTPVYFGEFHWHSDFSGDGQRPLGEALKSARDELCLDFAGPADHLFNGDYGKRTVAEQAEICRQHDINQKFATVASCELSRRYGHANLYTADFKSLIEICRQLPEKVEPVWTADQRRYNFKPLFELCDSVCGKGKALIIPHHTNMDSWSQEQVINPVDGRPYWCALHWEYPPERNYVRLIEIVQGRGSFEIEQVDPLWLVDYGGFGGSAQTALLRGYRLGFVGGTDNHSGWPTRRADEYCGITAVQAPSLDAQSIFDSLYARRCYATSGARIVADATLNGHPMGSEISLEPGVERKFAISIKGTASLASVQVISMGNVLADFSIKKDTLDFETQWCDERPGRPLQDCWYYIRARQTDGHCVWLSPFWVDLP